MLRALEWSDSTQPTKCMGRRDDPWFPGSGTQARLRPTREFAYSVPVRFLPSTITLRKIRFIRVW